jgi:hypothetical protein
VFATNINQNILNVHQLYNLPRNEQQARKNIEENTKRRKPFGEEKINVHR